MQITVQFPDHIAALLGKPTDISREMLEAYASDAYRSEKLSRHQISDLLGLDYWQTEDFLTLHQAKRPYTMADLEVDRASLSELQSQ